MPVWIYRNPQHLYVLRHQIKKERHDPTSCRTCARIRTNQFVNSTLCVVVVGYDFWLSARTESSLCWVDINTTAFFLYVHIQDSERRNWGRRLDQEAVLLYLSVTACFGNSHRRLQMTETDFSRVGEVVSPSWHVTAQNVRRAQNVRQWKMSDKTASYVRQNLICPTKRPIMSDKT